MKLLMICSVLIEIALVAFYVFSPLVKSGAKNLAAKTGCAVMFVVTGIFAAEATGGFTVYAMLIVLGAALGAVGDIILKTEVKSPRFFIGLASFLLGHIFYASAFVSVLKKLLPIRPLQIVLLLALSAIITVAVILAGKKLGASTGRGAVPVTFYIFTISAMLTTAMVLAVSFAAFCGAMGIFASLGVALGAILFVASDSVLALKTFAKNKFSISRLAVPLTYFPAQTILALSIYFVNLII